MWTDAVRRLSLPLAAWRALSSGRVQASRVLSMISSRWNSSIARRMWEPPAQLRVPTSGRSYFGLGSHSGGNLADDLHDLVDRLLVLVVPIDDGRPCSAKVETGVDLIVRGIAKLQELPVHSQ